MNRIGRLLGVALLCAVMAACAGSSGSPGMDAQVSGSGAGFYGGNPSAEVSEPLFRITQPGMEGDISHDFQVKNTGGGVLEILKITPG